MICFLILHYLVYEETLKCVDSIMRIREEDSRIVVVDNASPNGSGEVLRKHYADNGAVEVLLNPENNGFAQGNNYGYRYICKTYDPEFLVVLNNDVEILSDDFCAKIRKDFEREVYHVLGPDVYSTAFKVHQSPKRLSHYRVGEVKALNRKYRWWLTHKKWLKLYSILKHPALFRTMKYRMRRKRIPFDRVCHDVPLHGACLVFSKKYLENEALLFHPDTFFYYETEILDYKCMSSGYRTIYDPEIKVAHHQNASTNETYKTMYGKTLFANRCNYASTKVFLKYMRSLKDGKNTW